MGTLYIVATPIGNLEDITLRALKVLDQVAIIAAEDTRTTRKLLTRYNIKTPLTAYHSHSSRSKAAELLKSLETSDLAVVSDAGMPGISDPGQYLVQLALESGFKVVPIPGPSAPSAALSVSGLPSDSYLFLGFFPRRKSERTKMLNSVAGEAYTLVAFETPHRLRACLSDILAVLGDRKVVVCREMTKYYEELYSGPISEAISYFSEPRGEFTLVISGSKIDSPDVLDEEQLRNELRQLRESGVGARTAAIALAKTSGLSRREVYKMWLEVLAEGKQS